MRTLYYMSFVATLLILTGCVTDQWPNRPINLESTFFVPYKRTLENKSMLDWSGLGERYSPSIEITFRGQPPPPVTLDSEKLFQVLRESVSADGSYSPKEIRSIKIRIATATSYFRMVTTVFVEVDYPDSANGLVTLKSASATYDIKELEDLDADESKQILTNMILDSFKDIIEMRDLVRG